MRRCPKVAEWLERGPRSSYRPLEEGEGEGDELSVEQELKQRIDDALNGISEQMSESMKKYDKKGEGIASIIAQVLTAVTPVIVSAVVSAVGEVTGSNMANNADIDGLRRNDNLLNNRLERLEQYSRKDQIKIFGVQCEAAPEKEDTDSVVVGLLEKMGVECTPADISISHRLPSRGGKPPPIICKFMSRKTRKQVMEKKKNLKEVEGCERVFLADNLTAQRSKLLRKLKERDDVKSAWSIEGKIKAVLVKNGREKKITIDSLDDVSEFDFTEDEIEDLGLFM